MSDQRVEILIAKPSTIEPEYRRMASGLDLQLGIAAAFITIMIWASWLISVKVGTSSNLTTFDLAIMRYVAPALVLLPFLYKSWSKVMAVPKRILAGIVLGAGVPFFFFKFGWHAVCASLSCGVINSGYLSAFCHGHCGTGI